MRGIGVCRSDWRWPRLIVPQRRALCVLSKMGEIKETGGGGETDSDAARKQSGICKLNVSQRAVSSSHRMVGVRPKKALITDEYLQ